MADEKPRRRLIVVDAESTGIRIDKDIPIEIAWWCLDTDERGCFIPKHNEQWVLDNAQPKAMEVNGYKERILGQPQDDGTEMDRLHRVLRGQCIAGMNVGRADCDWLYSMFKAHGMHPDPWHYRLGELGSYAAGVLGLSLENQLGLADLCAVLGIPPEPEVHTAENGVTCTGLVLRELRRRRAGITALVNAHTNHCIEGKAA